MRITRTISAAALLAGIALAPALAWAQQAEPYGRAYGPHMMDWGGGWYGMIFGPLLMILVLAIVIAIAVLLVRWLGGAGHDVHQPHHGQAGRTALDILKERFARGEIDKEEFEDRRRTLDE
ncbi:MAG: SHOCT domain-containing protein [Parvibaculum sp.]|uniref:SHOCT domain-containing protein n=1 Tax=Parvibaculum sp. TaxID=2024848 RepID=UPI002726490A|nr:SHOCT domain-containing protein [Parvibaculum sp.]MDO8840205.1 SHOCT domain-containing protein [Parvibaculum sp.]